MIYKPSKLIYSSVHIDRVFHFIRDHFTRIPLYTKVIFDGPIKTFLGFQLRTDFLVNRRRVDAELTIRGLTENDRNKGRRR